MKLEVFAAAVDKGEYALAIIGVLAAVVADLLLPAGRHQPAVAAGGRRRPPATSRRCSRPVDLWSGACCVIAAGMTLVIGVLPGHVHDVREGRDVPALIARRAPARRGSAREALPPAAASLSARADLEVVERPQREVVGLVDRAPCRPRSRRSRGRRRAAGARRSSTSSGTYCSSSSKRWSREIANARTTTSSGERIGRSRDRVRHVEHEDPVDRAGERVRDRDEVHDRAVDQQAAVVARRAGRSPGARSCRAAPGASGPPASTTSSPERRSAATTRSGICRSSKRVRPARRAR